MKKNNKSGFTLIEILLYISLAGIIVFSLSFFLSIFLSGRVKSQSISEVEQQGQQIIYIMSQAIRNADNINYPTPSTNSSSLSITTFEASTTPTIFSVNNGNLMKKVGVNDEVPLNNSKVIIDNLNFINLSRANTQGNIKIILSLKTNTSNNKQEYQYEKTFTTSASLR